MKCELCHKAEASQAIRRETKGQEEELYVCKACAKKERANRKRLSQRTRKSSEQVEIVDSPEQMLSALADAVTGFFTDLGKDLEEHQKEQQAEKAKARTFPHARIGQDYRFASKLHLEGLHLIGELQAVERAVRALECELVPVSLDGVAESAHVFDLKYTGSAEQAKRIMQDLVQQEHNARVRLVDEMPRVLGDALGRALAILKNCRLVSPGELLDLLSPIWLGLHEGYLDGLTEAEVEALVSEIVRTPSEEGLPPPERDKIDAVRADQMNRMFESVMLNEQAEEKGL